MLKIGRFYTSIANDMMLSAVIKLSMHRLEEMYHSVSALCNIYFQDDFSVPREIACVLFKFQSVNDVSRQFACQH